MVQKYKKIYMEKQKEKKNEKYSFRKGYDNLRRVDQPKVRKEIMEALNLKYRASFYHRLNGMVIPKINEVEIIENIFKKYNITKIWGKI